MSVTGLAGSKSHEEATLAEIARWPGASVSFHKTKNHPYALVMFAGQAKKQTYPGTTSDSFRGPLQFRKDIRHALIGMGAVRLPKTVSEPSKPRQAKRKQRQAVISLPEPQPRQDTDRWLGPLMALKRAMEGIND